MGEWWLRTPQGNISWIAVTDESDGLCLLLIGEVSVNTLKQIQVESVEIDIGGCLFKSDWESQGFYMPEEREVRFDIALDVPRGERTARLRAIIDGDEYSFDPFTIELPQKPKGYVKA